MKRTTIYIPDDIHKSLRIFALTNGFSMTQVIIDALKTMAFLAEKGEEAKKELTPKQLAKVKENAKLMQSDINKRFDPINKKRKELNSSDYL